MAISYRFFSCSMSNEFFCDRNGTMTNCGGTRVNTAEWGRFMCPLKLFGYQTLYFITSKKYYTDLLPVMARVSESRMSIRCLYSITIWPLAITIFPRRNARDDDNWGRLINSYRNWVDGSAITTYQLNSQTLPLVTLKAKSLRKCSKGNIFFLETLKSFKLRLLPRVLNSWNFERI